MPKILIVDDDKGTRNLLFDIFNKADDSYNIVAAEKYDDIMKILHEEPIDIILLDIMMPEMDGFTMCEKIRGISDYKRVPIIFITALTDIDSKMKAFKSGATDYITKPVNVEEMRARVIVHLNFKKYHDELKDMAQKLKRAQDALLENAKMSAVGMLTDGFAHEFNNLLLLIRGNIDLCMDFDKTEALKTTKESLLNLVFRGSRIVGDLIEFSRLDIDAKKQNCNLHEDLKQVLIFFNHMINEKGIRLETFIDDAPPIKCSPSQLARVFINVIKNAVDSMETSNKKKLTIKLNVCSCIGKSCKYGHDREAMGKCIVVSVGDTGVGMNEEIKKKALDPFFTTKGILGGGNDKTPGAGLGLSISYTIVKRHNGFITIESEEGKGSTFYIVLPY